MFYTQVEELPNTERVRPRSKGKKEYKPHSPSSEWKMTVAELCEVLSLDRGVFLEWCSQGVLGDVHLGRVKSGSSNLTRQLAQRTMLVVKLVAAGIHPVAAGSIVASHKTNDRSPLTVELAGGVTVTVDRTHLP